MFVANDRAEKLDRAHLRIGVLTGVPSGVVGGDATAVAAEDVGVAGAALDDERVNRLIFGGGGGAAGGDDYRHVGVARDFAADDQRGDVAAGPDRAAADEGRCRP